MLNCDVTLTIRLSICSIQIMSTDRMLGKQLGEPLFDLPLILPEMALQYLITINEKLTTEGQNQVYCIKCLILIEIDYT